MDLNKAFSVQGSEKFQEYVTSEQTLTKTECFVEVKHVGTDCEANYEQIFNEASSNPPAFIDENINMGIENGFLVANTIGLNKSSSPRDIGTESRKRAFGQELSNINRQPNSPKSKMPLKRKLIEEDKENLEELENIVNKDQVEAQSVSKKRRHAVDSPTSVQIQQDNVHLMEKEVTEFLNNQKSIRFLNESSLSPILPSRKPGEVRQTHVINSEMSLMLACENDDDYDINNIKRENKTDGGSVKLENFYVNNQDAHEETVHQNFKEIENILNLNMNNCQPQFAMYEQLTINTNLDENFQPIQCKLNTPKKLDYFNNQFTDELGITVHREINNTYIDNHNLIMIAPNMNELTSNSYINVTNVNPKIASVHQSAVVDLNNNIIVNQNGQAINKNESSDDDEDDDDEEYEPTYSQVEGEKGRAKPYRPTPVYYKAMNLVDVEADSDEGSEIKYALKVTKLIFTKDELTHGIFPLPNGKSRSKERVAFDPERIAILKNAIKSKFSTADSVYDIEAHWPKMRAELNKKIPVKTKKETQSTNDSSIISRKPKNESEGGLKVKLNFKN